MRKKDSPEILIPPEIIDKNIPDDDVIFFLLKA